MKDKIYEIKSFDNCRQFEFVSEGPKGMVVKRVEYQEIVEETLFLLGFGDYAGDKSDDKAVTDNKDTRKVLLTVSSTLHEFFNQHPTGSVLITSDPVRMRLYEITIANNMQNAEGIEIFGRIADSWYKFQNNRNFEVLMFNKKGLK